MLSGGRNGSAVPVVTSSVIDPKSDLVAEIDEGGFDGPCLERRWLADAGLVVGSGRAVVAGPAGASLGCHRPRVAGRDAMDAILLVLRTGMQWNALNATGICSSSSAHRRFQEWEQAGDTSTRSRSCG